MQYQWINFSLVNLYHGYNSKMASTHVASMKLLLWTSTVFTGHLVTLQWTLSSYHVQLYPFIKLPSVEAVFDEILFGVGTLLLQPVLSTTVKCSVKLYGWACYNVSFCISVFSLQNKKHKTSTTYDG